MSSDGVSDILGQRFAPPPAAAQRWEDRHVRWTVWIDRDLREQIETMRKARGMSTRELLDELLRLGLESSTANARPPGRRRT